MALPGEWHILKARVKDKGCLERFHSRGQHLCKFTGTKDSFYMGKKVQLPQDWFGTQTWPTCRCFETPTWQP